MSGSIWKDYFAFTKKERKAVAILLVIICIFIVLPYFFAPHFQQPVVDSKLQAQLSDSLQQLNTNSPQHNEPSFSEQGFNTANKNEQRSVIHPFKFDPNTLNESGWKQLGLREKTIQTILNYRNKGGHFKTPEDIRKIYGLRKDEADMLIPFITIETAAKSSYQNKVIENDYSKPSHSPLKKININTATAEDWKAFPGIGEVLSNRIIKFRNAIHGFKSVEDLKKTYGLSDSVYQSILPYLAINLADSSQ